MGVQIIIQRKDKESPFPLYLKSICFEVTLNSTNRTRIRDRSYKWLNLENTMFMAISDYHRYCDHTNANHLVRGYCNSLPIGNHQWVPD